MLKQTPAIKLVTIVGLLLIPIMLLGYLFFQNTGNDIAFAVKERDGLALLRAVVPVVAKISSEDTEPTPAEMAALETAGAQFGPGLNVATLVEKFVRELKNDQGDHHDVLQDGRALILQIADNSNLVLDPQLDSYYLMEVAVSLIPELIEVSADLTGHSEIHEHEIAALHKATHQQLAIGEFTASLTAFKAAMRKVTDNSSSGVLDAELATEATSYAEKAKTYVFTFLTPNEAIRAKQLQDGESAALQQRFAISSLQMWKVVASNLEKLLGHRIAVLKRQQTIAGGFTTLVTLIAIGLAMTLLRRIVGKLDEQIVYLAHHDAMTRLKNRSAFHEILNADMDLLHKNKAGIALHLIDVDHFKAINDSLGHRLGDAVLVGIANRLTSVCGPEDVIARLGGDEFVVMQRGITDNWQVTSFADRLVTSLREPLQIEDRPLKTSVTVGCSLAPLHGDTSSKCLHSADMALYAAKAAGRDRACLFSEELNGEMIERQRIEGEVHTALADNRFLLNFQAQFDATGKKLRGFEALLRLRTVAGEIIPPLKFIPLIEQMGLIDEVGAWVLEKAAVTAAQWPEKVSLAVNISPLQLRSGKLCDAVRNALRVSGIEPRRLEIEVTENILMDDTKSVLDQLQDIKAMGVSIALDDFGSGYSSLSYLWRFPFDKLKIDRSFMTAYEADRVQAENILRTIVMLGHSLQMTVTAEGVETDAQANFLNGVKCDEIQGFLYSKPVPEQDLAALILKAFEDEMDIRKLISIIAPDNPEAADHLFKIKRKTS